MVRAGVLGEDDPYELLEGWLVPKMPRNPPHDLAMQRLQRTFQRLLPEPWLCFTQSAITTTDSEPEPDLAIVRGPDEKFKDRHPEWHEIALVVEVADSSLARDRSSKLKLYARAGIPAYWIVNLQDYRFECFSSPAIDDEGKPIYRDRIELPTSGRASLALDGQPVADIEIRTILD